MKPTPSQVRIMHLKSGRNDLVKKSCRFILKSVALTQALAQIWSWSPDAVVGPLLHLDAEKCSVVHCMICGQIKDSSFLLGLKPAHIL